jgi:hypothetical protein
MEVPLFASRYHSYRVIIGRIVVDDDVSLVVRSVIGLVLVVENDVSAVLTPVIVTPWYLYGGTVGENVDQAVRFMVAIPVIAALEPLPR